MPGMTTNSFSPHVGQCSFEGENGIPSASSTCRSAENPRFVIARYAYLPNSTLTASACRAHHASNSETGKVLSTKHLMSSISFLFTSWTRGCPERSKAVLILLSLEPIRPPIGMPADNRTDSTLFGGIETEPAPQDHRSFGHDLRNDDTAFEIQIIRAYQDRRISRAAIIRKYALPWNLAIFGAVEPSQQRRDQSFSLVAEQCIKRNIIHEDREIGFRTMFAGNASSLDSVEHVISSHRSGSVGRRAQPNTGGAAEFAMARISLTPSSRRLAPQRRQHAMQRRQVHQSRGGDGGEIADDPVTVSWP